MDEQALPVPFVKSVFHATDFSAASDTAFVHALAIALLRAGELTIMNTGPEHRDGPDWSRYPGVRKTLEEWNVLPPQSTSEAVFEKLGVKVNKVASGSRNTIGALAEYLDDNPTDLLVLATDTGTGLPKWLRGSVAQSVAKRSDTMTLFLPGGCAGFVSSAGDLNLKRILVAVDHNPDPRAAFVYATRIALITGEPEAEVHILHVGERPPEVPLEQSADRRIVVRQHVREGNPVESILRFARQLPADLIVTTGRTEEGIFGAAANSVTLGVLSEAQCPVLAVPDERL